MATLKINDLSVGDWVNYENKAYRLYAIEECGLLRGKWESDEYLAHIAKHIDYFEPIPITPEILAANGFQYNKKVFADTWYWTNEKDTMIEVGMFKDNAYLRIVQLVDGRQRDSRLGVKHVHQLQNALRLTGVEKEINL